MAKGKKKCDAPVTERMTEQAVAEPVHFKSAYVHSLHMGSPMPVREFLAHLISALLAGRYNLGLVYEKQPEQDGQQGKGVPREEDLRLQILAPDYGRVDGEGRLVEGLVHLDDGVPAEHGEKLAEMVKELTPVRTLMDLSVEGSGLHAIFSYAHDNGSVLAGMAESDLTALKKASAAICQQVLAALQQASESLAEKDASSMDPIIAKAERDLLTGLAEQKEAAALKEYFGKLIELHGLLEKDNLTLLQDDHHHGQEHEHGHEGGCCGHSH